MKRLTIVCVVAGMMLTVSVTYGYGTYKEAYDAGKEKLKVTTHVRHNRHGALAEFRKDLESVRRDFLEALSLAATGEEKAEAQLRIGDTFYFEWNYPAARARYAKVPEIAKATPAQKLEARFQLGNICFFEKKFAAARTEFTKVLETAGSGVSAADIFYKSAARLQMGLTYFYEDNYPAAVTEFTKRLNMPTPAITTVHVKFHSLKARGFIGIIKSRKSTKSKKPTAFLSTSCTASKAATTPTPKAPIVYVAADGSGDFNCDGKDDHVEINQALKYVAEHKEFTTVHLKGPNTYWISDSICIGSDTILEGDKTAVVKLANHANWPKRKALVTQMSKGVHDITIRGFEIDGNDSNNWDFDSSVGYLRANGGSWYNIIHFRAVNNIRVHNMYLHHNMCDALLIRSCKNVHYHDNVIHKHGHDGLYAYACSNVYAYNNRIISNRTDSGLRISNTNNAKIYNNIITCLGCWTAIEIQKSGRSVMNNIEVYNNILYSGPWMGITAYGYGDYPRSSVTGLHIHHNIIYDAGARRAGGISISGFHNALIENNVIDGCTGAGVVSNWDVKPPSGSGYIIIVRNNIISNTRPNPKGLRAGIWNKLSDTHSIISEYNNLYNNAGGDYKGSGITSTGDIHADPLYADRSAHDYHLKSQYGRWNGKKWVKDDVTSPCVDAGDPKSKWKNEPAQNGGRINMGAYGNTKEASKSIVP